MSLRLIPRPRPASRGVQRAEPWTHRHHREELCSESGELPVSGSVQAVVWQSIGRARHPAKTAKPLAGPLPPPALAAALERGARWAGRGLLFLSGDRSPLGEAGQGAPAPPYSFPPAGPRRAATMSTAAFHISSLLEKMTSSDKDFRCVPRPGPASPLPLKPLVFMPSPGAGRPQGPFSPRLLRALSPALFRTPHPPPQRPHGRFGSASLRIAILRCR